MIRLKGQSDPILKVNTRNCGHFRKISGTRISMKQLTQLISSNSKINRIHYLSASGQAISIDGSKVNYANATYIYLIIDKPTCTKGEKIVAWRFRKRTGAEFGEMDFISKADFDLVIAMRNESSIGTLKFENQHKKQEFLQEIQGFIPSSIGLDELEKVIKESIPKFNNNYQPSNKTIIFDTKMTTTKGKHIYVEGVITNRCSKTIIIKPQIKKIN